MKFGTYCLVVFLINLLQVVTSFPSESSVTIGTTTVTSNELEPATTIDTTLTTTAEVKPVKSKSDSLTKTLVPPTNSTSKDTNSTSSNYVIEYKPLVFDSPEDIKAQQEWGGNCSAADWDKCKKTAAWFGKYISPNNETLMEYILDCKQEPVQILCLTNNWTVTRCNLLCMSRCNVSSIQFLKS